MDLSKRTVSAIAAFLALGLSLGACSPSRSSGESGTNGAINITAIGVIQSAQVSLPDAAAAFRAKVDAVNAAGGVNGREINLTICDDKFDQNTAASCAREAVSNKAVMVVSHYEPYSPSVLPVLEAATIPYVYGTLAAPIDGTSPMAFPKDAGIFGSYSSLGEELIMRGCQKVGAIVDQQPNTITSAQWLQKGVQAVGGQFVSTPSSTTATEFSAPLAKLTNQDVDCVVPATDPSHGPLIVTAVKQSGMSLKIGAISSEFSASALRTLGSAADGMILTGAEYRPTDISVPTVAKVLADMKQYQPSVPLETKFGIAAWSEVEALTELLKTIKGPITSASVLTALSTFTPRTGLYATFSYSAPAPDPSLPRVKNWSYLVWTVENGAAKLDSPDFRKLAAKI